MESRFQFSVRRLLIAITAIAVVVWPLTAPPSFSSAVAIAAMLFLSVAITIAGICNTNGFARTFFIGASLPCLTAAATFNVVFFYEMADQYGDADYSSMIEFVSDARAPVALAWAMGIAVGLAAVMFHWAFLRRGPRGPV